LVLARPSTPPLRGSAQDDKLGSGVRLGLSSLALEVRAECATRRSRLLQLGKRGRAAPSSRVTADLQRAPRRAAGTNAYEVTYMKFSFAAIAAIFSVFVAGCNGGAIGSPPPAAARWQRNGPANLRFWPTLGWVGLRRRGYCRQTKGETRFATRLRDQRFQSAAFSGRQSVLSVHQQEGRPSFTFC
jgi:hypothetical protein